MSTIRATVVLPYVSNLPRDVTTNTFWFSSEAAPSVYGAEIAARLIAFYTTIPGGAANPLSFYLSGVISRAALACRVQCYDMSDPAPRPPSYEQNWTLSGASGDNLPNEVSVVGSFQGDRVAGVNQARRRGRVFIGPLKVSALGTNTATNTPTVVSGLRTTLKGAMTDLASQNTTDAFWVARSQTTGDITTVTNGWVDNDFDTQRRRQPRASVRDTWGTP